MDDSFAHNQEVWPTWAMAVVSDVCAPGHAPVGTRPPGEFAERLYALEALNPLPSSPRPPDRAEPYSLQWFLEIENQRHGRQGRWIPRLLEFARHTGETLLGLGDGLGTDWLQYARHGANVIVCSPAADQLTLVQRNFELRGLVGRFLTAQPSSLPLESSSVDVVCVSGLLGEVADPGPVVREVYRVLKPGGKVLAVTPAKYDVEFLAGLLLPWRRWLRRQPTASPVVRFSGRRLHRLFGEFVEHRIHKRHLSRREVPYLWRWAPRPVLERLMGRVLVLKAFKPLRAALAMPIAA